MHENGGKIGESKKPNGGNAVGVVNIIPENHTHTGAFDAGEEERQRVALKRYLKKTVPQKQTASSEIKERHYEDDQKVIADRIAHSRSFDDLENVLRGVRSIMGSTGWNFSGDRIIDKVRSVRSGRYSIETVPRTLGLRDKVIELLAREGRQPQSPFKDFRVGSDFGNPPKKQPWMDEYRIEYKAEQKKKDEEDQRRAEEERMRAQEQAVRSVVDDQAESSPAVSAGEKASELPKIHIVDAYSSIRRNAPPVGFSNDTHLATAESTRAREDLNMATDLERINTLKGEIKEINGAVQASRVNKLQMKLGFKQDFNDAERHTFAEEQVRLREGEIHRLESRLRERENEILRERVYARIDELKTEVALINHAVQTNTVGDLQARFGFRREFSQGALHDFAEEQVRMREEEIRRLEAELQDGASATAPEVPSTGEQAQEQYVVEGGTSDAEKTGTSEPGVAQAQQPEVSNSENGPSPKRSFFDTRFEAEFGITHEQLASIEGFDRLSPPQQKLMYENFAQITLGMVREEAERLCREMHAEKRTKIVAMLGERLGNCVAGIREAFSSKCQSLKQEKEVVSNMRTGGFDAHKAMLNELITGMAKNGPRVHENADGELVVDLVNIRERARSKEVRDEEWYAMNELNQRAHAFARIPTAWRTETLGVDVHEKSRWERAHAFVKENVFRTKEDAERRAHREAYTGAETEYTKAKEALERVLRVGGKSDMEIAQTLIGIDSRVFQLKELQTNPDAFAALREIEERNVYAETAKHIISSPGMWYFGLGFAGRSVGGLALGFLGAPMVSAGIASMRSWDRSAAELRERDRNARMGVRDTKEGALNIVPASDLTKKTEHLIDRYRATSENTPEDAKTRERLLAQLRSRVEYIHDKQVLGRVSYASREAMVTEQTRLAEVFGEAIAYIGADELAKSDTANARTGKSGRRLDAQLKKTEHLIEEARIAARKDALQTSAARAGAFSLAGAAASMFMHSAEAVAAQVDGKSVVSHFDNVRAQHTGEIASRRIDEMLAQHEHIPTSFERVGSVDDTVRDSFASETPMPTMYPPQRDVFPESVPASSDTEILAHTSAVSVPESPVHALESTYTVTHGDTLTHILKERVPDIERLATDHGKDNAIANILKSLTKDEMERIGIHSGNVNLIHTGDTLNMEELRKVIADRHVFVERAAQRFGGFAEVAPSAPQSPPAPLHEIAPRAPETDLPGLPVEERVAQHEYEFDVRTYMDEHAHDARTFIETNATSLGERVSDIYDGMAVSEVVRVHNEVLNVFVAELKIQKKVWEAMEYLPADTLEWTRAMLPDAAVRPESIGAGIGAILMLRDAPKLGMLRITPYHGETVKQFLVRALDVIRVARKERTFKGAIQSLVHRSKSLKV